MNTVTKRKVTVNSDGGTVISNLRVPFTRAEHVWVLTSDHQVVVTDVEPAEEEPLSDVEVSEATTLYEKLQGMDLVTIDGEYRFLPKVQP